MSSRRKGSKPVFYFLHLAFQEYLAAMYLVHSKTILSAFNSDPRYDMIWRFAAGFMTSNAGPLIELVVRHAQLEGSKRLTLLALDCLRESRHVDALSSCLAPLLTPTIDLRSCNMNSTQFSQLLQITSSRPGVTAIYACNNLIGSTTPDAIPSFQSLLSRNTTLKVLWYDDLPV